MRINCLVGLNRRARRTVALAAVSPLCFYASAGASFVVSDYFDTYANQAAFESAWGAIGTVAPISAELSNVRSVSGPNSIRVPGTATSGQSRNRRTFGETGALTVGDQLIWSYDFYDSSASSQPQRNYANLQDTNAPTLTNQLVSMGLNNTQLSSQSGGSYYMARILGYTPSAVDPDGGSNEEQTGGLTSGMYFKLNDFGLGSRTTGWHNLKVLINTDDGLSTDYAFYVDNLLAERVSNVGTAASIRSYENLVIGSGLSNGSTEAFFDNMKLEFIPAPHLVISTWSAATSGTWNVAANWSSNPNAPNNGSPSSTDAYDAVINATGANHTVTVNSDITIQNLLLNSGSATINQTTGTFKALNGITLQAGTYQMSGGTISATTISRTGGSGTMTVAPGAIATLDAVALDTGITVTNATLNAFNGLTLNHRTVTLNGVGQNAVANIGSLNGTGEVVFDGSSDGSSISGQGPSGGTLAIGSSITVSTGTAGGVINAGTLINNGDIYSRTSGKTLTINAANFINNNYLAAFNNGTLDIGGTVAVGGLDSFYADRIYNFFPFLDIQTGTVQLSGTLLNTGHTLNLHGQNQVLYLSGGTISGGTITSSVGTGGIRGELTVPLGGVGNLNAVTLAADFGVGAATMNIYNGLTFNNSSFYVTSGSFPNDSTQAGRLSLPNGSQSWNGTGTILFSLLSGTQVPTIEGGSATLTLGSGITVRTQSGESSGAITTQMLINNGTISSQANLRTLTIGAATWTNNGTVQSSGGTLAATAPPTNLNAGVLTGGHYYVLAGSTMNFAGAAITTNAADIRLEGANSRFDAINSLTSNTGTFTIASGRSFTFVGPLTNTGTLNAAAGGTITIPGGTNTGTINGQTGGTIIFNGDFIHGPTSLLNGSGSVIFNGTQTFNGTIVGNFDLTLDGAAQFGAQSITNTPTSLLSIRSGGGSISAGAQVGVGRLTFTAPGSSPGIALISGALPAKLTVNGDVTVASGVIGSAAILTAGNASVDSLLDLGGVNRIFSINDNGATPDLLITARVTNGGITTSGAGVLGLTNSNSYTGGTTLSGGRLQVSDTHALGTGSVVFSGGMLDLRSDAPSASFANMLAASSAGTAIRLNVGRITAGPAGVFQLAIPTLGSKLTISGSGTAQLASVNLATDTTIENEVPVEITGPITGNFGITRGGSSTFIGALVFSGNSTNTYTGATNVNQGALLLSKTATAVPGALQISGGTVKLIQSHQIADSAVVSISGTGSFDLNGNSERIGGLSGSGGTVLIPPSSLLRINGDFSDTGLILLDGAMICDYSASSPIAFIKTQVQSGFAQGAWTGPGIRSPLAAANQGAHRTAIGFGEASALDVTTFLGESFDSSASAVLLRYTLSGDANLDGQVNSLDFTRLAANFDKASGAVWSDGDYNYDGLVNALDFNAIATNFGQPLPSGALSSTGILTYVPEPIALAPLAYALLMLRRRFLREGL